MEIGFAQLRDLLNGNTQEAGLDTFFVFAAYACLLPVLWLLWQAWRSWKQVRMTEDLRAMSAALVYVVSACYPLGLFFKLLVIGPDFMRWHLTDFGFSVAISLLIFHGTKSKAEPNRFWSKDHPLYDPDGDNLDMRPILHNLHKQYKGRKSYIGYCLALSYIYEIAVWLLYRFGKLKKGAFVGSFDIWDVVSYTLGAAIAILCLRAAIRWTQDEVKAVTAEERAAFRAQDVMHRQMLAANPHLTRPVPPTKKPRPKRKRRQRKRRQR